MSYVDFHCPPVTGLHGQASEGSLAFAGEIETSRVGRGPGEPADLIAGNWESAWIDLGGEG